MNEQPWPPPQTPDLGSAFKKAHDAEPEKPPQTVEHLTGKPQQILVPPGVSRNAVPSPQRTGPPPLPITPEQQRAERIERMRQGVKASSDFNRANQQDRSI
jgi:hypothetical protein